MEIERKAPMLVITATLLAAGSASARLPLLRAGCPTGIGVDADRTGGVLVNGHEAHLDRIRAGDERYEIPEAAVFGG
jgi:hypothetical protein